MGDRDWYDTLCVIADGALPAYWRMSNGAGFWWAPEPADLLADRFARQPFVYQEIASITVFAVVQFGQETFACDLPSLRRRLGGVPGLVITEMVDVVCPPVRPPIPG